MRCSPCLLLLLATATFAGAADFTAGNVVVYRVGDGIAPLANTGAAVYLDEYSPSGALVQSIPLPTTLSGANRRLIASGTATSEGLLSRSADGRFLILAGYDAAIPTTGLSGTTGSTINRTVGRIDQHGVVDTSTGFADFASGNNPRSAASVDGSDLYLAGGAGGVRFAAAGASTSTQLSSTVTNLRQVQVVDGQLYVSTSSGTTVRIGAVGTGLPTAAGQTIATLPGVPLIGSPYGFALVDLSPAIPGPDVLYVADDAPGTVQKYSLTGGLWTPSGSATSAAARGLATTVAGGTVTVFVTTGGSGSSGGGTLSTLVDASGHGGMLAGTVTPIASAAPNTAFRGVALAPSASAPVVAPAVQITPLALAAAEGGPPPTYAISLTTIPESTVTIVLSPDGQLDLGAGPGVSVTRAFTSTIAQTIAVTPFDDSTVEGLHNGLVAHAVASGPASYATLSLPTVAVTISDNDVGTNTPPMISSIPALANALGDPTNPTAIFNVGDAESPAATLALAVIATSNPVVAPLANATVVNAGDGSASVAVVPAGIGYATLTIRVTDPQGGFADTTLNYAASAGGVPSTRFHASGADASAAVAIDAAFMVVGIDEDQVLRVFPRTTSGLPVAETNFSTGVNVAPLQLINASGGLPREVDIEAATRVGNRIFWLGSGSNSSGGSSRPNRSRLFATDLAGTGAATTLSFAGRYDHLKADLIAWDQGNTHGLGANHFGLAASAAAGVIPESPFANGFNIEGLAMAPGSSDAAYVAFRAPLAVPGARTRALIVPVLNFASLAVSGGASGTSGGIAGSAVLGAPIELDLGGRGIRDLARNDAGTFLIVAGPVDDNPVLGFRLFTWDGQPGHLPQQRSADLTGLNPEAIVGLPAGSLAAASTTIQILSDNGSRDWYGDGIEAKSLPEVRHRKFRSDLVALGGIQARIHDIQGAAHRSPLEGASVASVPGIVTAVRSNGFWFEDSAPDADPATSEGLFVFTGSAPTVMVGDAVAVAGTVTEFRPGGSGGSDNLTTTELTSPLILVLSSGNPLPETLLGPGGRQAPGTVIEDDAAGSVEIGGVFDPAQDGIDFYESLEGMRLRIDDAVATGPIRAFGRGASLNREITVLPSGGVGAATRTPRGGILLTAGDANPERVFLSDTLVVSPGLPETLDVGDGFPVLRGVLDYSFGNFKLLLTVVPSVTDNVLVRETTALSGDATHLTVATYNVENLDPSDGTFAAHAAVIVGHLLNPDIICVEEIQDNTGATNNGVVSASQTWGDLIAAIAAQPDGASYEYRDIAPTNNQDGGQPGGNIRQGFLFRTDRGVAFVDRGTPSATAANAVLAGPQLALSPGRIDPTNSAFTSSRKPVAGEFTFQGRTLFVVSNHFNSKGGDDPLFGRWQPPVRSSEVQRHQQAQILNDFVSNLLAVDPLANVVVAGDFNDFEFSQTMSILRGSDELHNLIDLLPEGERYDYVFDGNSQSLDHILVSDRLLGGAQVDVVHVNAEFADQVSDHDPIVARLQLVAPLSIASGLIATSILEDQAGTIIPVTLIDPDAGVAPPVTVSATSSDQLLVSDSGLVLSGSGALRELAITPVADAFGMVQVQATATDGLRSAMDAFLLEIIPVNDAPSFQAGGDVTVNASSPLSQPWATLISAGPANEAGQGLSFQVSTTQPGLFVQPPAINAAGVLSFVPTGVAGSTQVTVLLMDNGGTAHGGDDTSAAVLFTVTIQAPVDLPPTITCAVQRDVLWPPFFQFVDVGLTWVASDDHGIARIEVAVTQDEPTGVLPGLSPDAQLVRSATGAVIGLRLRAELDLRGNGRVYLIQVTAVDSAGQRSSAFTTVVVPLLPLPRYLRPLETQAAAAEADAIPLPFDAFLRGRLGGRG